MEDNYFEQYIIETARNQASKEDGLTNAQTMIILREIANEAEKACQAIGRHPSLNNLKDLLRKAGY